MTPGVLPAGAEAHTARISASFPAVSAAVDARRPDAPPLLTASDLPPPWERVCINSCTTVLAIHAYTDEQ